MTDTIADFQRDGFVVVRGVVPRHDCARLAARATEILDLPDGQLLQPVQRQYGRHKAVRMVKLNQLTEQDPEFEELAHRSEIVDRIEELLGPGSRLFRDVVVVKPAHTGGRLRHHQDSAYWDVEPKSLVSAWVALADAPPDSGPLSVVPGSHRALRPHDLVLANRLPLPKIVTSLLRRVVSAAGTGDNVASAGGSGFLWRLKRLVLANGTRLIPGLAGLQDYHVRDIKPSDCQVLDVEAGDVVFFHSLLVHGSGPNNTNDDRIGAIISYMRSGSVLPRTEAEGFPLARRPTDE